LKLTRGRIKRGADRAKDIGQGCTQSIQSRNAGNGNKSGDQTIFNGRCARFVIDKFLDGGQHIYNLTHYELKQAHHRIKIITE